MAKARYDSLSLCSSQIREAQARLQALREEHASRILTLNSKLADLYKERGANNEQLQQLVQTFDQGHKELRKQVWVRK